MNFSKIKNLQWPGGSGERTVIIIMGDHNLPDIYWPTLSSQTPQSKAFCDLVFLPQSHSINRFPYAFSW